jgi:hypothetical protein
MVLPVVAAARAASAAGQAGATALGLGMGKSDMDLTRDLFKLQMRQAKRLWTADWAEASVRHGEACMQSAQQHAESQAMAMAAYYQAEKLASQGIKLARDQDSRSYEMAWRAEVRESLRDELANQYNRFNIVMLCDTVCLGCVFSLVAEGTLPEATTQIMISLYVGAMGVSITLFTISLWFAVIVVRRLHEHTAAILERKLFAQSEDMQKEWQRQLQFNLPTGPNEMYLMNQAYEKWVARYIHPMGNLSVHMMSIGVVTMFITAGLLTHNRYAIEYNSETAVPIFWSMVAVTITAVISMKLSEDRKERKKQGVYDNSSWQDNGTSQNGPFAKINKAADELSNDRAMELASSERMESLNKNEVKERRFCAETKALHERVDSLRKESQNRAKMRREILNLLTTAAEELDALPEELTSRLNKLLHDIDEADARTAELVTIQEELGSTLTIEGSSRGDWSRIPMFMSRSPRQPMPAHPIDAQRLPVSLGSLRRKLGESSHSTLLRIQNLSTEPLRLRTGVQLKEGKYVKSLNAVDPTNKSVCYHLYPGTEIPPRSEIVIAAQNTGRFVPTSGIQGEVVYTNKDESWMFRIKFSNPLLGSARTCSVQASNLKNDDDNGDDLKENHVQFWRIEKQELDIKANNEVIVAIDALTGDAGRRAALSHRHSHRTIKNGFLMKNKSFGLKLQWHRRWVDLTPTELRYSETPSGKGKKKIALRDITSVKPSTDVVKTNVFEVQTRVPGSEMHRFAANSDAEMTSWIRAIDDARTLSLPDELDTDSQSTRQSVVEDGFECVENGAGFSVLPL